MIKREQKNLGNGKFGRRTLSYLTIIVFSLILNTIAPLQAQDTPLNRESEGKMTGIRIIPLPVFNMNSDFGFQYGLYLQLFNYGDGGRYPDHYGQYNLMATRYASGSGDYSFTMETFRLIPGTRFNGEISYSTFPATSFYGENGAHSVYNPTWTDISSTDYKSRMFYSVSTRNFKISGAVEGSLPNDKLKWNTSLNIGYYETGSVDIDQINERKSVSEQLPTLDIQPGLFEIYKDKLGLIPMDETKGWVNTINLGINYDSRNFRQNPTKGVWTGISLELAPGFIGNKTSFSKITLTHRQYIPLRTDKLTFAYRLQYEQRLTGDIPFYYAFHHGVGGSTTVRGILYSKINGDAFAFGNAELRWKTFNFKVNNISRYIGFNAFYDIGSVIKGYDLPSDLESNFSASMPDYEYNDFFTDSGNKVFQSAGIGLVLGYSQSIATVINIGKSFDPKNGGIGFSFDMKHAF